MGRLCERPGCSEPAAVSYGMRIEDLVFWLDAFRESNSENGVLCGRHGDSMVVPRGWTLDDLRDPELHLFRPPPRPDGPASRRRRRTSVHVSATEQLSLGGMLDARHGDTDDGDRAEPAADETAHEHVVDPTIVAVDETDDHAQDPAGAPHDTEPSDTEPSDTEPCETEPSETQPCEIGTDAGPMVDVEHDDHDLADLSASGSVDDEAVEPRHDDDAVAWKPAFDNSDDLNGLLAARSPLLARAFRGGDRNS